MPVLPAVDSTTSPPGLSSPRFSASRIIHLPARSFTDWPGFMNSALPRMVQPVSSDARLSLMSGVSPMASTTSFLMVMSGNYQSDVSNERDPKVGAPAIQGEGRKLSMLLCEDDLPDVDIPRQETGLTI